MTTTDLTTSSGGGDFLQPEAVNARIQYARALAASNLLPDSYRAQPANVLLAIEYGHALGLEPIAAIQGISVIKGKPTLSADLMAAVVRRAGHKLRVRQSGMSVTATLIRRDDPDFEYQVTWDQAKAERAGLWGQRGPWTQYAEQMLRSRAITEVCRQGASEALSGAIYAPDELATADAPQTVEASPAAAASSADAATSAPSPSAALDDRRVGFVASWLTQRGIDADPQALLADATRSDMSGSPADLETWLTARYQADDGVVDAEVLEEVPTDE